MMVEVEAAEIQATGTGMTFGIRAEVVWDREDIDGGEPHLCGAREGWIVWRAWREDTGEEIDGLDIPDAVYSLLIGEAR